MIRRRIVQIALPYLVAMVCAYNAIPGLGSLSCEESFLALIARRACWQHVNADPGKPESCGALHWCRYDLPGAVDLDWLEENP